MDGGLGAPFGGEEAYGAADRGPEPLRGGQVPCQEGEFVENFGERGELIALEDFVESLDTGHGIVNAVDIVIGIIVEVVVFEEKAIARDDADVTVEEATDEHAAGIVVPGLEFFGNLQNHTLTAPHIAIDPDNADGFVVARNEGVQIVDDEVMLAQPAVVDVLVVVPGVPVVWVVSRRNFSSA